jgi:hypothetical protein
MLDLIGYSTAPEDMEVAQDRLDQFVGWLLSVPWWVVLGFALVSTLWLMWVSWPRHVSAPAEPINSKNGNASRSEEGIRTRSRTEIDFLTNVEIFWTHRAAPAYKAVCDALLSIRKEDELSIPMAMIVDCDRQIITSTITKARISSDITVEHIKDLVDLSFDHYTFAAIALN